MFVASLAADPELYAQLGDRKPTALGQHDKSPDSGRDSNRVTSLQVIVPQSVTHHRRLSVTYLRGSYRQSIRDDGLHFVVFDAGGFDERFL